MTSVQNRFDKCTEVATHFNTGTYHNHFIVNSVNMFTGKKFNCNIGSYYHLRELSDELCREYGLTVIEMPIGKTSRSTYFADKITTRQILIPSARLNSSFKTNLEFKFAIKSRNKFL